MYSVIGKMLIENYTRIHMVHASALLCKLVKLTHIQYLLLFTFLYTCSTINSSRILKRVCYKLKYTDLLFSAVIVKYEEAEMVSLQCSILYT